MADDECGQLFAPSGPHPGVIDLGISEDSVIETSPGWPPVTSGQATPDPLS
jgi:hypothetical protein